MNNTEKNENKLSRKSFIKKMASAYALAVAGPALFENCSGTNTEKILSDSSITWGKAPCRFCGTGCGVMVGVKNGKAVAVVGDKENQVNKGLLCVKGYHLPAILYGKDRLTKPLIRKNGKMTESSWDEALKLIADKYSESIKTHGPDSVAVYGSGQWTIQDGYAATKFFKGGIGTNNVEANARLCMASAVVGFVTSFGKDEPMGCYDDFENADVFITWGNNMAEMHPVLFSRMTERKRQNPLVTIVDIGTRRTRTTEVADIYMEFIPHSDLAIANGIAHEIVFNGKVNEAFVGRHVTFKAATENIGFGLEGQAVPEIKARDISFEEYKNFLKTYTPEYVEKVSGVPAAKIRKLGQLFSDPSRKIMSLWCMGVNQHTRGTWMNNLIYNIHLLTGKISEPGNGPFSLTGQPSACGTVREVGTLTHGLPGGRVVKNPEHRAFAERIWGIEPGTIPPKPSAHTIAMFRKLKAGKIKNIWIQVTNPMVTLPDMNKYTSGIEKSKPFIVVSDVYPTPTTEIADVILPSAMWIEREACFGNSERRTQQWNKLVNPPGECKPDSWQLIEVAKRMGFEKLFPWKTEEEQAEGLYTEYRKFTLGVGKDVAEYSQLKQERGMRWPVVNGKETLWRYREGYDPYVKKGQGYSFYGNKKIGNRAIIWIRPYQPPPESPDKKYPYWLCTGRVIEHWHTGSMTRRVAQLHKAMPGAYVELNPNDAKKLGISNGTMVKVSNSRGSIELKAHIKKRGIPPEGSVFVPFFDESKIINMLTLDAHCPMSKQPDYKKCAVNIEKA
ncbi:MAG: molybdopterin-dependent oxidoreductase [Spirochaetia bacterium]|nr:molybdopterin-dependent oxidoreductase [Spirochaetia bacterium]